MSAADPRYVFLTLAALRRDQVERGGIELEQAIDDLVPHFERIRPCWCMDDFVRRCMAPLPSRRGRAA